MSGYDYGNTRLRAMKSRLLTRDETEALADVVDLQALVAALTKTPYRSGIETSLARATGLAVVMGALRFDFTEHVERVNRFYKGSAARFISVLMQGFDIQNLKTVLRGVSNHLPPAEIMEAILPFGEIHESLWLRLASMGELREVIDTLVTMRLSLAEPLLDLQASRPGASLTEIELEIERWRFRRAAHQLKRAPSQADCLQKAIEMEADLINILTVLRFAHAPAERKRLDTHGISNLLVGTGTLSFELLEKVGEQDTVTGAIANLTHTAYSGSLQDGQRAYQHSGRVSDIERHLRLYRLRWMANQIRQDPLGMGVPVGYMALKTNEVRNLRWISNALSQRIDPRTIKAQLEFPQ